MSRFELIPPELEIDDQPICQPLARLAGSRVIAGDSLVEILCGSVSVDLPAPVSGTVVRQRLVREEDRVVAGERLVVIEVDADEFG